MRGKKIVHALTDDNVSKNVTDEASYLIRPALGDNPMSEGKASLLLTTGGIIFSLCTPARHK